MTTPTSGEIKDHVHYFPVRVYVEDTDAGGVVYHGSTIRHMERARTELLRLLGIEQSVMFKAENKTLFVVKNITVDYKKSARIDDILRIETHLASLRGASMELAQNIYRGDEHVTAAMVRVAITDPEGRPMRLPSDMAAKFQAFQGVADG